MFKQQKAKPLPESWIEHEADFLTKGMICHEAPRAVQDVGQK